MSTGADAIEKLIPTSLDSMVRENRDLMTLRLAADETLVGMSRPLIATHARKSIHDWQIIERVMSDAFFERTGMDRCAPIVHLVGYTEHGESWITSKVDGVDLNAKIVVTKNSIYRLSGEQKQGEPDRAVLMQIAVAFNQWGIGKLIGLPEFFS